MSTHPLHGATRLLFRWLHCELTSACVLLVIFTGSLAMGADLMPPEVPNPYNTSEARAIRDHLEETYRLKVSDKLSLDELRDIYRKTWNADQDQRYLAGDSTRPADAQWVKTHLAEQEQEQRAKWIATLARLGVEAPADATVDQLRALAAQTAREQEEAAEKKRTDTADRLRAEAVKQNEAAAAAETKKSTNSSQNGRGAVVLTPILSEQEILTEARIRVAFNVFTTKPATTERERKLIELDADSLIAARQRFIKNLNGVAVATNGAGIEVWLGTKSQLVDKEKGNLYLLLINTTPDRRWLNSFEVVFTGSKRNTTLAAERGTDAPSWALSIREYHIGEYYLDKGQTMKVENVSFR